MAHIIINAEECKACTLCVEYCPRQCIAVSEQLNTRGHHPAALIDAERCTGCGICATMCPDVCIEVYRDVKTPSATP